jgi:hypothetical protein
VSIISAGGAVTGADVAVPIDPRDYFNTIVWAGNAASPRTLTGVGFQPDLVWGKVRNYNYDLLLYDAVRGAGILKALGSSNTAAEGSMGDNATNGYMSAFTSDGFSVVGSGNPGYWNSSGENYVAWNWKADGAGSSNSDGSITSTVSASTDSGFSIVTYTGTATNATVGHGLGVAPSMVIVKNRSAGSTNWCVYHIIVGNQFATLLNSTSAPFSNSNYWNNTTPTSSVFSLGNGTDTNGNTNNLVAYCFAEISGFSKIGSYTGNGSATGPSVTTDFEPTWLMIKRRDSTGDWIIHDSARDATNPRTEFLEANTGDVEATGNDVDFNATSFQIKSTSATVNASGGTYIYMCIA